MVRHYSMHSSRGWPTNWISWDFPRRGDDRARARAQFGESHAFQREGTATAAGGSPAQNGRPMEAVATLAIDWFPSAGTKGRNHGNAAQAKARQAAAGILGALKAFIENPKEAKLGLEANK